MSHQTTLRGNSPAAVVSDWLEQHLLETRANVRLHHRKHLLQTLAGAVLLAELGAIALVSLAERAGDWQPPMAINAAMLAVAVALLTAAAFYPLLRQQQHWLTRAAAIITRGNIDFLSVLGKLTELRNGETAGHNLRVTLYTLMFAESLQLTPKEIVRAVKGAMLHDVGKLAVPDSILGKPGPLTADERQEMNKHVRYGLEIISQSAILQEGTAVVGSHHEHYDGHGYPVGLKGEAIPLEARLFALVDVFDALTSRRVYKPAQEITTALATMAAERGTHFDPYLLDRFLEQAPLMARQMPLDEASLARLLLERLLPYVGLIMFGEALPDLDCFGRERSTRAR